MSHPGVYNVRLMTLGDLEQVSSLYSHSFPEHIMVRRGQLNNPAYLRERIEQPNEQWVVEEQNGVIRGVAALSISPSIGLGEIERVCVSAQHRGLGIAIHLCSYLVSSAVNAGLGLVQAFARGDQPAMQRTFEKLGFRAHGVSPIFPVVHNGVEVREQFVHMCLVLKPETIDEKCMSLIPQAARIFNRIYPEKAIYGRLASNWQSHL